MGWRLAGLALAGWAFATGCLNDALVFVCKTSDQCAAGGRAGTCEGSGYCSFSDGACQSGRRYGRLANEARAGQCTECGNGAVDTGEECDDGNGATDDACLPTCRWNVCGDGFVRKSVEECDDRNLTDGDGCSHTCLRCATGDGTFVWSDNGHCYTRTDAPRTWNEAQRACSQRGAHLATYNSEVEQLAVRPRLLAGTSGPHWIGLRDPDNLGYSWITGEPVVMPMRDFTSTPTPGLCAANQGATGTWTFASCENARAFICEDAGWMIDPKSHHAYRAFFSEPSWMAARQTCPTFGGHLVTVTDSDEHEFLAAHFFGSFWLGAAKSGPGADTWSWLTAEPFVFRAFADGEPDDGASAACLALGTDRRWHDRPCDGSWKGPYGFICEVE